MMVRGLFSIIWKPSHYPILSFIETGTIRLLKPEKESSLFACRPVADGKCLACAFTRNFSPMKRAIVIYDIPKVDMPRIIPLPKEIRNHCLLNFAYINADSIIVQTSYTENPDMRADSTLFLMNSEGRLVKIYSMDSAPLHTLNNGIASKNNCPVISDHPLTGLAYYNGKVYFETVCGVLGVSKDMKGKSLLGEYDLKDEKFSALPLFYYPPTAYSFFWGDQHIGCPPTVGFQGEILTNSGFSPYVQVWETSKRTVERHYTPTQLFDSVRPMTTKWNGDVAAANTYSSRMGNYGLLFTNPFEQMYLRVMNLPPKGKSIKEQNKKRIGISLFDRKFQIVGEGEITELDVYPFAFTSVGMLAYDNRSFSDPDSLTIKIFDIKTYIRDNPENVPKRKKERKQENFIAYLQQHKPELSLEKNMVVVVPIGNSCSPCVKSFVSDFVDKLPKRRGMDYHFLLTFEDERTKEAYMKNDSIFQNLPLRSADVYDVLDEYVIRFFNPQLYFIKNAKVVKQIRLQPDNLKYTSKAVDEWRNQK